MTLGNLVIRTDDRGVSTMYGATSRLADTAALATQDEGGRAHRGYRPNGPPPCWPSSVQTRSTSGTRHVTRGPLSLHACPRALAPGRARSQPRAAPAPRGPGADHGDDAETPARAGTSVPSNIAARRGGSHPPSRAPRSGPPRRTLPACTTARPGRPSPVPSDLGARTRLPLFGGAGPSLRLRCPLGDQSVHGPRSLPPYRSLGRASRPSPGACGSGCGAGLTRGTS